MENTILVVEDETIIALDMKEVLEDEGYSVITVKTVEKAIEIIQEKNICLILLDVNLKQDKDGIDLGNYLLKNDKIPYIYITSFSDRLTIDRIKDTRPHGYIIKPFKTIDIITTVEIVLNNFKHFKVDPKRNDEEINNNIPFKIKETISYINDHIVEKIKISELAEITPWKTHHFIRVFTQYVGITPYQYILQRKIKKAEALLVETNFPINEIAFDIGFQSYSNFCNAFKKANNNQTPESFRAKKQAEVY